MRLVDETGASIKQSINIRRVNRPQKKKKLSLQKEHNKTIEYNLRKASFLSNKEYKRRGRRRVGNKVDGLRLNNQ